ncbi:hypothetical protein HDV05_002872 [Chytridiales sp. JEL 0842]|nr:hypothetical protein HDV05_002872 [Chytridiales sp. JEL 0842]
MVMGILGAVMGSLILAVAGLVVLRRRGSLGKAFGRGRRKSSMGPRETDQLKEGAGGRRGSESSMENGMVGDLDLMGMHPQQQQVEGGVYYQIPPEAVQGGGGGEWDRWAEETVMGVQQVQIPFSHEEMYAPPPLAAQYDTMMMEEAPMMMMGGLQGTRIEVRDDSSIYTNSIYYAPSEASRAFSQMPPPPPVPTQYTNTATQRQRRPSLASRRGKRSKSQLTIRTAFSSESGWTNGGYTDAVTPYTEPESRRDTYTTTNTESVYTRRTFQKSLTPQTEIFNDAATVIQTLPRHHQRRSSWATESEYRSSKRYTYLTESSSASVRESLKSFAEQLRSVPERKGTPAPAEGLSRYVDDSETVKTPRTEIDPRTPQQQHAFLDQVPHHHQQQQQQQQKEEDQTEYSPLTPYTRRNAESITSFYDVVRRGRDVDVVGEVLRRAHKEVQEQEERQGRRYSEVTEFEAFEEEDVVVVVDEEGEVAKMASVREVRPVSLAETELLGEPLENLVPGRSVKRVVGGGEGKRHEVADAYKKAFRGSLDSLEDDGDGEASCDSRFPIFTFTADTAAFPPITEDD